MNSRTVALLTAPFTVLTPASRNRGRSKMRRLAVALMSGLILLVAIVADGSSVAASTQSSSRPIQGVDSCIVVLTGDLNLSGSITSADIICGVQFIFLQNCEPQPCYGAGDVNCSGVVNSADVIYLVNFVFKSGPEPCDVCTSDPEFLFLIGCIQ